MHLQVQWIPCIAHVHRQRDPALIVSQRLHAVQVQGMHDSGAQLGLHSDMALGPVAHFDGRDHVRNQGKGRGNHRVGTSSSGIGSGNNSMMGGGMA